MGKLLRFKSVELLQDAIDEYFDYCENRTKKIWDDKREKEILIADPAPYTMSGLARRLNLSRQALMEYSHKGRYGDAVKAARDRVHEDVETRLMEGRAQTGAIFNLKNNFGWKDQSEIDNKHSGTLNVIRKSNL